MRSDRYFRRGGRGVRTSFAVLLTFAGLALAQDTPEVTVWLKNGGVVRGAVIEVIPGDHTTVQLATGEIRKIPASEIERVGPMKSAAPAPTPPPAAPVAPAPSASVSAAASPAPRRVETTEVRIVTLGQAVTLQTRPRLDRGPWSDVCVSPCERQVSVIDREFRVGGAAIASSNTFVMEPGDRPTKIEVNPGKEWLRWWGRAALFTGLPVFLVGGVGLGIDAGTNVAHHETFGAVGLGMMATGGAMLLTSLPMLYFGRTRVFNVKGDQIGLRPGGFVF